jgi:hypothetical protein
VFRVGERVRIDYFGRWGTVEAVNEQGWPAIHADFVSWTGDAVAQVTYFHNPALLPPNDIISRLADLGRRPA